MPGGNKSYTPEETVRLHQSYSTNHPEAYADNRINGEYLNPNFNYLPSMEDFRNRDFYDRNLNFHDGFGDFATGVLTGSAQGYLGATTGRAANFWALGSSFLSNPLDTTSQIANGLLLSMSSPDRLWSSYRDNKNDVEILTYLYQLQGNTAAAAEIRAKYDAEMAINLLPAGRVGKLGEVGAEAGWLDAIGGSYRDGRTVGTGARELTVEEYLKQEKWAAGQYESIRTATDDVSTIAKNLGVPEFQVERIKDHLFFNEHTMRDGSVGRFDPDAGIAETWSRFQSGTFKQEDIQLFKHEYFESRFEGIFRQDYGVSHDKTQIRYPSPLD